MSLTPLIRNTFYDGRSFQFGTIWTIADELLSIPDADRDGRRILHEARAVLFVANNQSNQRDRGWRGTGYYRRDVRT